MLQVTVKPLTKLEKQFAENEKVDWQEMSFYSSTKLSHTMAKAT